MNDEELKEAFDAIKAAWDRGDTKSAQRIFRRVECCRQEIYVLGADGTVSPRAGIEGTST